jgi:adenylate kinase
MAYRTVLLFGAPGVGKGTQGRLLGAIPGFVHMASGDMFRALDRRSELGRKFLDYSSRGLLVPDEVTIEVWKDHVQRRVSQGSFEPQRELLVLDGIPRNVAQAKALAGHLLVLRVVHLRPPDVEEMVCRLRRRALKEGRHDDADEAVIRRRFEVYEEETAPVLRQYDAGLIAEVGAVGSPAEVLLGVLAAIVPAYRRHFGNPLEQGADGAGRS